jgi:hypothetical protein
MQGNLRKHLLSLFVFTVFIILAIGSVDSGADTKDVQSQASELRLSANEIIRDYIENEVKADLKYDGKVVEITGVIDGIGKDLIDTIYITVGKVSSNDFLDRSVQCYFTESEASSVGNVSVGEHVTVKGKIDGLMGNVHMKACRILPN